MREVEPASVTDLRMSHSLRGHSLDSTSIGHLDRSTDGEYRSHRFRTDTIAHRVLDSELEADRRAI